MIQLNDEQYWLYAAVDPDTNELLHTTLEPTTNTVIAHSFLTELSEKHDVDTAVFSLMGLTHYKMHISDTASISDTNAMETGTVSEVSFMM